MNVDPALSRFILAAVWDVQERQRFPNHPRLRVPVEDALPGCRALVRAEEVVDAVAKVLAERGVRPAEATR